MIEHDPERNLLCVNGIGVTLPLIEQALTEPWKWAAARERLPPTQRDAVEAAIAHVEQHGFPEAT